jgi:hypothetical protein
MRETCRSVRKIGSLPRDGAAGGTPYASAPVRNPTCPEWLDAAKVVTHDGRLRCSGLPPEWHPVMLGAAPPTFVRCPKSPGTALSAYARHSSSSMDR